MVFEVLSPGSGQTDRIIKVREYGAVPSIRRYVFIELLSIGATVLERADAGLEWTVTTLVSGDPVGLPEIGITIPLDEFYTGTEPTRPSP